MKKGINPFAGKRVTLRDGSPIEELRLGGSQFRALSESTGEINAGSTKELAAVIGQLMALAQSGDIRRGEDQVSMSSSDLADARREVLATALASDAEWQSLGSDIAARIEEQRNREAFMPRLCLGQNLKTGEYPRVITQAWDGTAVVATGPAEVGYSYIRSKQFMPAEFELIANLRADAIELEQIGGDVLDKIYNQGLDAIMTQADRIWKMAADSAVALGVNPIQYISGQLTPQTFGALRQGITDWNLPAASALISNDYWQDIIGNADFSSWLDPVSKYDLVFNGELGSLLGLPLLTDGFRQPNQKVLERGEIYIVAAPEHHACYSDRGGVRSKPTDGANEGSTGRGWLLSQILSFTLANPKSVVRGKRI